MRRVLLGEANVASVRVETDELKLAEAGSEPSQEPASPASDLEHSITFTQIGVVELLTKETLPPLVEPALP